MYLKILLYLCDGQQKIMMDERLEKIAKVNYWNGNHFNSGVERTLYLDRIIPYIGNRVIKVVTGQRRAGKSWLLRQVMASMLKNGVMDPSQILYVNKEFYRFSFLQTADDLMNLYKRIVVRSTRTRSLMSFLMRFIIFQGGRGS